MIAKVRMSYPVSASDSEEEYEVCSEAESVDSAEEEAFQQGLDLALDR